jgi:hypothetical protein
MEKCETYFEMFLDQTASKHMTKVIEEKEVKGTKKGDKDKFSEHVEYNISFHQITSLT